MQEFLDSNPGLRSRFGAPIRFDDYSKDELLQVFERFCSSEQLTCGADTADTVLKFFADQHRGESFGNARLARQLFEHAKMHQADRLIRLGGPDGKVDLQTLTPDDVHLE
jgi:Holliday junction resolvasome RuvABC ATP-dependent DNA helicase subunit